MKRIKMIDGDEMDALSKKSKNSLRFKPGERKSIKRKYNKRERKFIKLELKK